MFERREGVARLTISCPMHWLLTNEQTRDHFQFSMRCTHPIQLWKKSSAWQNGCFHSLSSVWFDIRPIASWGKDIPLEWKAFKGHALASSLQPFAGGLRLNNELPYQPPWPVANHRFTTKRAHCSIVTVPNTSPNYYYYLGGHPVLYSLCGHKSKCSIALVCFPRSPVLLLYRGA
jgi:hypothetical protein